MRNPASGGIVIIDYKKKTLPTKKQVATLNYEDPAHFTQTWFYFELLQTEVCPVEEMFYLSLEDDRRQAVTKLAEPPQPRRQLTEAIEAMSAAIDRGDFRPRDRHPPCPSCKTPELCRVKFYAGAGYHQGRYPEAVG